jgi:hypothetical protein
MVLWCRSCGALIGLRPPIYDWTVDRNRSCVYCASSEPPAVEKTKPLTEEETASARANRTVASLEARNGC